MSISKQWPDDHAWILRERSGREFEKCCDHQGLGKRSGPDTSVPRPRKQNEAPSEARNILLMEDSWAAGKYGLKD